MPFLPMPSTRRVADEDSSMLQRSPITLMFWLSSRRLAVCISTSCLMKMRVPGSVSSWNRSTSATAARTR